MSAPVSEEEAKRLVEPGGELPPVVDETWFPDEAPSKPAPQAPVEEPPVEQPAGEPLVNEKNPLVDETWFPDDKPTIPNEPSAWGDVLRGIDNLQAVGGGLASLLGNVSRIQSLEDWGMEVYHRNQSEARMNPAAVGSYENIEDTGDLLKYAREAVFENLAMFAPSMVTGGIGGIVARKTANTIVANLAEKMAADQVAKFVAKRVFVGSALGAYASSASMETGSIYGDVVSETGVKDPATAVAFGMAAGVLDALPEAKLLQNVLGPKIGKQIVRGFMKRLGVEGTKQFLREAPTEAIQTIIEEAAIVQADPTQELFDRPRVVAYTDAFLKGGFAGTGMGVAGEVAGTVLRPSSDDMVRMKEEELANKAAAETPAPPSAPAEVITPEDQRISDINEQLDAIETELAKPDITPERKAELQLQNMRLVGEATQIETGRQITPEQQTEVEKIFTQALELRKEFTTATPERKIEIQEGFKELEKQVDEIFKTAKTPAATVTTTPAVTEEDTAKAKAERKVKLEEEKATLEAMQPGPLAGITEEAKQTRIKEIDAMLSDDQKFDILSDKPVYNFKTPRLPLGSNVTKKTVEGKRAEAHEVVDSLVNENDDQIEGAQFKGRIKAALEPLMNFFAGEGITIKRSAKGQGYRVVPTRTGGIEIQIPSLSDVKERNARQITKGDFADTPEDIDSLLRHEVIHTAHYAFLRDRWIIAGKKEPFNQYVHKAMGTLGKWFLAEHKGLAPELKAVYPIPVQRKDESDSDYQARVEFDVGTEMMRMMVERARVGAIQEDFAIQNQLAKKGGPPLRMMQAMIRAATRIREVIARFLNPGTSTPEIQNVFNKINAVLDQYGVIQPNPIEPIAKGVVPIRTPFNRTEYFALLKQARSEVENGSPTAREAVKQAAMAHVDSIVAKGLKLGTKASRETAKKVFETALGHPVTQEEYDAAIREALQIPAVSKAQPEDDSLVNEMSKAKGGKKTKVEIPEEFEGSEVQLVGANIGRAIEMLGETMYSRNLPATVGKEVFQNAVDNVKKFLPKGKGVILYDTYTKPKTLKRMFAMLDNGTGMTPEIVRDKFLVAFESGKDIGEGGGFGMAKLAFLGGPKSWRLITVAKDASGRFVQTVMSGTGKGYIQFANNPPRVKFVRDTDIALSDEMTIRFSYPDNIKETGTFLEFEIADVWTAERWVEHAQGYVTDVEFGGLYISDSRDGDGTIMGLAGVTDQKRDVTEQDWGVVHSFSTPNAEVDIIAPAGAKLESGQYFSVPILNRSIVQFSASIRTPIEVRMPEGISANIKSKVKAGTAGYPFSTSRESITDEINKGITAYFIDAGKRAQKELNDKYAQVREAAPKIVGTNMVLIDIGQKVPKQLILDVVAQPETPKILEDVKKIQDALLNMLKRKYGAPFGRASLAGLIVGAGNHGVHFGKEGPKDPSQIFHDPWTTWELARNDFINKKTLEYTNEKAKFDRGEILEEPDVPVLAVNDHTPNDDIIAMYDAFLTKIAGIAFHEALHQATTSEERELARLLTFKSGDIVEAIMSLITTEREYDETQEIVRSLEANFAEFAKYIDKEEATRFFTASGYTGYQLAGDEETGSGVREDGEGGVEPSLVNETTSGDLEGNPQAIADELGLLYDGIFMGQLWQFSDPNPESVTYSATFAIAKGVSFAEVKDKFQKLQAKFEAGGGQGISRRSPEGRAEIVRDFFNAASEVAQRTAYGQRTQVIPRRGFMAMWSNGNSKWVLFRAKPKPGDTEKLDANQIIFTAKNRIDAQLIVDNLPVLPLNKFSVESTGGGLQGLGAQFPPNSAIYQELEALGLDLKPDNVDVVKATSDFIEVVSNEDETGISRRSPELEQLDREATAHLDRVFNPTTLVNERSRKRKSGSRLQFWDYTSQELEYMSKPQGPTFFTAKAYMDELGGIGAAADLIIRNPEVHGTPLTGGERSAFYQITMIGLRRMRIASIEDAEEFDTDDLGWIDSTLDVIDREYARVGTEFGQITSNIKGHEMFMDGQRARKDYISAITQLFKKLFTGNNAEEFLDRIVTPLNKVAELAIDKIVTRPEAIAFYRKVLKDLNSPEWQREMKKTIAKKSRKIKGIIRKSASNAAGIMVGDMESEPALKEAMRRIIADMSFGIPKQDNPEAAHSILAEAIAEVTRRTARETGAIPERKPKTKISELQKLSEILQNPDLYDEFLRNLDDRISNKWGGTKRTPHFMTAHNAFMTRMTNKGWMEGLLESVINEKMKELKVTFTKVAKDTWETGKDTLEDIRKAIERELRGQGVTDEEMGQMANDMDALMSKAVEDARAKWAGTPGAVNRTLRELGQTVAKVAKSGFKRRDEIAQEMANQFIERLGLADTDKFAHATRLKDIIQTQLSKLVDAERKSIIERILRTAPPFIQEAAKKKTGKYKSGIEKIIEMANLGALDHAGVYAALADKLGLPPYNAADAKNIQEWGERIGGMDVGRGRTTETIKLRNFIESRKGVTWKDMIIAGMYASMLSGPSTQLVNAVSNFLNLMGQVWTNMVLHPERTGAIFRAMLIGFSRGGQIEFRQTLRTGLTAGKLNIKIEGGNPLEYDHPVYLDKAGEALGNILQKTGAKYVVRLLQATDMMFYKAAQEVAYAGKTGMTGTGDLFRAKMTEARRTLEAEGVLVNEKAGMRQVELRALELADRARALGIYGTEWDEAHGDALVATYNQEPKGWIGQFGTMIGKYTAEYPAGKVLIPFTRVVCNVLNTQIEWSPFGLSRYFFSKTFRIEDADGQMVRDNGLLVRALTGSVLTLGALATLLAKYDEDDEDPWFTIYGSGPKDANKKRLLYERGWKPNTIKIGPAYISYLPTPLSLGLAAVGTLMDRKRDDPEIPPLDYIPQLALAFVQGTLNQSFLTGVADLFSAFESSDPESKVNRFLARTSTLFVPNLFKQIDAWASPGVQTAETFIDMWIKQLPIARWGLKPMLNVFGQEVERVNGPLNLPFSNRFITMQKTDDPVFGFIGEHGLSVPSYSKQTKLGNEQMTEEQYYNYVKTAGPQVYEAIRREIPRLRGKTKEEKQEKIDDISRDIKRVVRQQMRSKSSR